MIVAVIALLFLVSLQFLVYPWQKLSPFTEVTHTGTNVLVTVEGTSFLLKSINDVPTSALIAHCQKRDSWRKRFAEDLPAMLCGQAFVPFVPLQIKLGLANPETGSEETRRVRMTFANRSSVYAARRECSEIIDTHALDEMHAALREQWSYYHAPLPGGTNAADFDSAIAELHGRMPNGMPADEFRFKFQEIIAMGIDGHARVDFKLPGGFTPFLVKPAGTDFVAFKQDRSGFLKPGFPYLESIDGLPLTNWFETTQTVVCKGSPQYRAHHNLRYLRYISWLRSERSSTNAGDVVVVVRSPTGKTNKLAMPVAKQFPTYGTWPRTKSKLLAENIGYLRLPRMNDRATREIRDWMPKFKDARGLIVDVRGNGGGSREALLHRHACFHSPDDPPRVMNATVFRKGFPDDQLKARFMYRKTWKGWKPRSSG